MSPLLALKLSDTVLNSVLKLAEAPNNIISTCFSRQKCKAAESMPSLQRMKIGSNPGCVWPSALIVGKVTARVCLSKRFAVDRNMSFPEHSEETKKQE